MSNDELTNDVTDDVVQRERHRFRWFCNWLPRKVDSPVFVKVGANDGVSGDPCSDILLAETAWNGLLIEPVPYCFDRLAENFHDESRFKLSQTVIGPIVNGQSQPTTFYYVAADASKQMVDPPSWYDQLGSLNRNHIVSHLDGRLEPFIRELTVTVHPLSAILQQQEISDIHLLHVDVEGYDFEVLKTLDFAKSRPWLIYIEHMHLSTTDKRAMIQLLQSRGYLLRNCGPDFLAMSTEASEILEYHDGDELINVLP